MNQPPIILSAISYASRMHSKQRRKDQDATPYINHPVAVAVAVARFATLDEEVLAAAILHDTMEDTKATEVDIRERFGDVVAGLVVELTDDKSLPWAERKRLQIEHAPSLSVNAKALKIADKLCNVRDVVSTPPVDWSHGRMAEYITWSRDVVSGCLGSWPRLDLEWQAAYLIATSRR